MKRIFTLLTLVVISAITMNLSAQSIVGKWNADNNITEQTYKAIGGTLEKCVSTITFNEDGTSYTQGEIIVLIPITTDVTMRMSAVTTESSTWKIDGNKITMNCIDNAVDGGITFSDPAFNSQAGPIWEAMMQQIKSAEGTSSEYNLEFFSDNEAKMSLTVNDLTLEYRLSRIE